MHLDHKAGDKVYIDFAGKKLQLVDPQSGELRDVEVFVMAIFLFDLSTRVISRHQRFSQINCFFEYSHCLAYI